MEKLFCEKCGKEIKEVTEASKYTRPVLCKKCLRKHQPSLLEIEASITEIMSANAEKVELEKIVEYPLSGEFDKVYGEPFDRVLHYAVVRKASDVHLKSMTAPVVRYQGTIIPLPEEKLSAESILEFIKLSGQEKTDKLDLGEELDYSFEFDGLRFRANAYKDMHGYNVSLRLLANLSTDFDVLGIPQILKQMVTKKSGLILVTGPTGSGKTTTLNCVINYINETQKTHIIILEDPIEFVHTNKQSIITQREIGKDTRTFRGAIEAALREDPDIIMVGEMREISSISAAITAAETGHLVLSTLHTKSAENTIDRVIDVFPPEQQAQIRTQLANVLIGVVSQQLVPSKSGLRRYLATEVMLANNAVKSLIRLQKTYMIPGSIQTSREEGMYTMQTSLDRLVKDNKITAETKDSYLQ